MIKLDVIEESNSDWSSNMEVVKKTNEKIRLCLDARILNSLTKKLAYCLPLIESILSRLYNVIPHHHRDRVFVNLYDLLIVAE